MKIIDLMSRFALIAVTASLISYAPISQAAQGDCQRAQQQLTAKVMRLERMANQRRASGDNYGYRRLRNFARIIKVHISNLPCTSNRVCLL